MEYTKEQLKEKFKKLPKDIQQELLSEDLGLIIQLIGQNLKIPPEQALDVEYAVVSVLMGTSHPKDFIRDIQERIAVSPDKARVIAEEINEAIFQPLKESLKIVHNIKDEGTSQEASLASTASQASTPPVPPVAPKPPIPAPTTGLPAASLYSTAQAGSTTNTFPQMIVPGGVGASVASEASVASMPKTPEAPKPSQNIFEQKLQGVFKMPREETILPTTNDRPQPPQPPRAGGVDPYREPPK